MSTLKEFENMSRAIKALLKDPTLADLILEQTDGRIMNTGPRTLTKAKVKRNKYVRSLFTRGLSKTAIGQKVGINPVTVAKIIKAS